MWLDDLWDTIKGRKIYAPRRPTINDVALLNVARAVLESPHPQCFNMGVYGTPDRPACALGHYAMRTDLQHVFDGLFKVALRDYHLRWRETGEPVGFISPLVRQHFGVTDPELIELFGPTGCGYAATPQQAAQYIYDFVTRRS